MVKRIITTIDGEAKTKGFTQEEIVMCYDNMLNQFAHQCVARMSGYQNVSDTFDDYKQMARIKVMEKFDGYDIEKRLNFSTLLVKSLKGIQIDLLRKSESQMRKSQHQMLYIDATNGESGNDLNEVITDNKEDVYFETQATDLEKFLVKRLSKDDIIFYTMDLKKRIGKASPMQKLCLTHTIDSFSLIVGRTPDKKEDLAVLLNISRPTLNKRIKLACEKVRELAEEFCISNMELAEIPF